MMAEDYRKSPEGFRFRLQEELQHIYDALGKLSTLFRQRGFQEIYPPLLEYVEIFNRVRSRRLQAELYKFMDSEGHLVALRPDFTPSIARIINTSPHFVSQEELNLFYQGEVFRISENHLNRHFFQFGAELFGGEDPFEKDSLLIKMVVESLKTLQVPRFVIELGSIDVLKGLLSNEELSEDKLTRLRDLIHRKDSTSLDSFLDSLPLQEKTRTAIRELPHLFGEKEVIGKARKLSDRPLYLESLDRLERLYDYCVAEGWGSYISLELGFTRGYNYYTGLVFEILTPHSGESIGGGGRYDELCRFFGKPRSACGFALNIDRIVNLIGGF